MPILEDEGLTAQLRHARTDAHKNMLAAIEAYIEADVRLRVRETLSTGKIPAAMHQHKLPLTDAILEIIKKDRAGVRFAALCHRLPRYVISYKKDTVSATLNKLKRANKICRDKGGWRLAEFDLARRSA